MDAPRARLCRARRAGQGALRGVRCAPRGRRQCGEAAPARRSGEGIGTGKLTMAMTRRQRRITLIALSLGVLALAVGLVLNALKDSIVFFNSPTDILQKQVTAGTRIRLGGLVAPGSVQRGDNLQVHFKLTDGNHAV